MDGMESKESDGWFCFPGTGELKIMRPFTPYGSMTCGAGVDPDLVRDPRSQWDRSMHVSVKDGCKGPGIAVNGGVLCALAMAWQAAARTCRWWSSGRGIRRGGNAAAAWKAGGGTRAGRGPGCGCSAMCRGDGKRVCRRRENARRGTRRLGAENDMQWRTGTSWPVDKPTSTCFLPAFSLEDTGPCMWATRIRSP